MNDNGIHSRAAALQLLSGVIRKKQPLDQLMTRTGAFADLPPRDRAYAHNLVATALRRLGQIDAVIGAFLERPLGLQAAPVTDILRLGTAQLLFTDTADHAALDTSVELVRQAGRGRFDKLVNAVLRRVQREGAALIAAQDAPRLNTPDWLWQSWETAYGEAICRRIAESHLTPAPLDLSVKQDAEGWARKLSGSAVGGNTVRLPAASDVTSLEGFADGAWWVQDLAASLPVRMLGEVAGGRVLDLCAAPGGKTAQLIQAGASVTAVDRSQPRMARLAENLNRLGMSAELVTADAMAWRPSKPFDGILLDAPCSATGTIRRHPDLPHTKSPGDLEKLTALQGRLLERAADWIKPGGVLLFATCSLQQEEGPAQIDRFLDQGPDFQRAGTADLGADMSDYLDEQGDLRTFPCHNSATGGMDGFYTARLRRRG